MICLEPNKYVYLDGLTCHNDRMNVDSFVAIASVCHAFWTREIETILGSSDLVTLGTGEPPYAKLPWCFTEFHI
jgi:hypothetical protein